MKISDLKEGTTNVEIVAEVVGLDQPREISKYGKTLRVANALLRDDSGTISLVLWNENIDKVSEGNTVRVENGYVGSFQNKLQLTLGKFGKLTVLQ